MSSTRQPLKDCSFPRIMKYRPLRTEANEIRILILLPHENEEAPIQCEFEHCSLNDNPVYEALSYVWGDPKPLFTITCDGQAVDIRSNLFIALRRFRKPAERVRLWADALCINQSSIPERNAQVAIMGSIYRQAHSTFMCITDMEGYAKKAKTIFGTFPTWAARYTQNSPLTITDLSSESEDVLFHLLSEYYWDRVWIIQEIILSHNPIVFYGTESIDWTTFSKALLYVQADPKLSFLYGELKSCQLAIWSQGTTPSARSNDLLSALLLARTSDSTDTRDQVYGILGLTNSTLTPDYNISKVEVYKKVADHLINNRLDLDVLSACIYGSSNVNTMLPSWCPDWSSLVFSYLFLGRKDAPGFQASGSRTREVRFETGRVLILKGIKFDKVDGICPDTKDIEDYNGNWLFWCLWSQGTWYRKMLSKSTYGLKKARLRDKYHLPYASTVSYGGQKAQLDAFLELLFMGDKGEGMTTANYCRLSDLLLPPTLHDMIMKDYRYNGYDDVTESRLRLRYFFRKNYMSHFFVTKKGYMGISWSPVLKGDVVAVLLGGKVPYLLRPRGDRFVLIGECMVAGIMNGEVIDELDAGKQTLREFALK